MGITIITNSPTANLEIPVAFIFWGYIVAYVIHIIDESLMGETFVGMVRKLFWPKYEWKHFFGFNTMLISLAIISIIIFEIFNGLWIIAPFEDIEFRASDDVKIRGWLIPGSLSKLIVMTHVGGL
ncbi:MAG: hypothetical protein ACYDIA_25495 [Candidatus Humimicrobiaceae bacterium]